MRTTEVRHDDYWVVDHAEDCPILEVVEMQDGLAEDTKYEDALGDVVQFCLDGGANKSCHYCGSEARFEKDDEDTLGEEETENILTDWEGDEE